MKFEEPKREKIGIIGEYYKENALYYDPRKDIALIKPMMDKNYTVVCHPPQVSSVMRKAEELNLFPFW